MFQFCSNFLFRYNLDVIHSTWAYRYFRFHQLEISIYFHYNENSRVVPLFFSILFENFQSRSFCWRNLHRKQLSTLFVLTCIYSIIWADLVPYLVELSFQTPKSHFTIPQSRRDWINRSRFQSNFVNLRDNIPVTCLVSFITIHS